MSVWAKSRIPAGTPVAALYDYEDEQGRPVYRKEKYVWQEGQQRKKAFKLRGFLGYAEKPGFPSVPRWDSHLDKSVRRVPYHLPALRQAIARGVPVYLVDGEKDVETLEQQFGQVATTCPLGTMGHWRGEWAGYFYGATQVILIADKDPSGQGERDAWNIAESLQVLGIPAEIVRVPVGKDISEWAVAR